MSAVANPSRKIDKRIEPALSSASFLTIITTMIRFHCSKCAMKLMVEPEFAGTNVSCPGCGTSLSVPAAPAESEDASGASGQRQAWKETDPTNPNFWIALGIGACIFGLFYLVAWPFPKSAFYAILTQRGWVNYAETFLFGWGVAFLILKFVKFRHQQSALTLDVLPVDLGREISKSNLHVFITHVYSLPIKLRDSLMVNRIRKALELFEVRQVNSEVATMMNNQSNIDGARIGGSYTLVKVFIWAIPILGFVGTVIGLAQAIGFFSGVMTPEAAKDTTILLRSMGGVTTGLATTFDTTLLALIYAIFLALPMSSMQKQEEDNLNHIDAYCNEILLPRLNDGSNAAGGDMGALTDTLTASLTRAHTQFLTGLDGASKLIREQSQGLEKRAEDHNKTVQESFNKSITAFNASASKTLDELGESAGKSLASLNSVLKQAADQVASLEKAAATQQAQIDASVKASLAKLHEDSSKVVGEAVKVAVTETAKSIEGTIKPAVQQVSTLTDAVKAATVHVAALQKQASENQSNVIMAMQESSTRLQQDASKLLGDSIRAAAEHSAKSIEDTIKPAAQQVTTLADAVRAATVHVASLEKQAGEHQAHVQKAMQESITRVQQDASKMLGDSIKATAEHSAKAMEELMKPAVTQLSSIGETAKNAVHESTNLQRQSREQHSAAQQAFLEATAKLQRDLAKSVEDSIRPIAQQVGSLGESLKSATAQLPDLQRQMRDQQGAAQQGLVTSIEQLQRATGRSLEETIRPATQQVTVLAEAVKDSLAQLKALDQASREQQASAQRTLQEAVTQLGRDNARAVEETSRPATQQVAALAEAVRESITQLQNMDRAGREQQTLAQRSLNEAVTQISRDTARALEELMKPAVAQLSALSEAARAASDKVAALDRHTQEHQTSVARTLETGVNRMHTDATRAVDETMKSVAGHLAALQQGIAALNSTLVELNGKQIIVQQVPKPGLFGRMMGKG